MQISAKVRPGGFKRGVKTEAIYKAMGFKGKDGPDLRDVVGQLKLDARCGNDTLLFASLFRLFSDRYYVGKEHKLVIYDKQGNVLLTTERKPRKKAK